MFSFKTRMLCWTVCVCLLHHIFVIFCMEKTTFFVSDQNFKDLISREFILTEETSLSLVQCALDCQSMEHCKSFFFKEEEMACKLASEVIDSTNDLTSSTGMKYFVDKSETVNTCPKQLMVYGSNITLDEEQVPGSVVAYTCAIGFESDSGGGTVTCLVNGSWSAPSDPCTKCGTYSSLYFKRPGKYLYPPQNLLGGWYATTISWSYIDASECTSSCTNRVEFTCLATYYSEASHYCLDVPVRVEENVSLYGPYYYDNSSYVEYTRLCV